uniref:Uncharacterized protein n=1 Tax=Rhizophora mucronata TaxID=61149 RepID=A0A2P2NAY4_RHIMU
MPLTAPSFMQREFNNPNSWPGLWANKHSITCCTNNFLPPSTTPCHLDIHASHLKQKKKEKNRRILIW